MRQREKERRKETKKERKKERRTDGRGICTTAAQYKNDNNNDDKRVRINFSI